MTESAEDIRSPAEGDILFRILPPSLQAHLRKPIPDQLWHYTSIGAMHAILEHGKMYGTDARFLNDREELIHAAKYAEQVINEQLYPSEVIEFVRHHVNRTFGVFLSLRNPYRNYVTCFTSCRDDLSQWRAYSGSSSGACVGFDLRQFRGELAPCIYRDEEKKCHLEGIFAEIFKVGDMCFNADPELLLRPDATLSPQLTAKYPDAEHSVKLTSSRLLPPIMRILPLFKDQSFEAENEWRIITLRSESDDLQIPDMPLSERIFYRPQADSLVPTINVDIKHGNGEVSLTGLILGPGSHVNSSDAVNRYLKSKKIGVEAETSAVPYRSQYR